MQRYVPQPTRDKSGRGTVQHIQFRRVLEDVFSYFQDFRFSRWHCERVVPISDFIAGLKVARDIIDSGASRENLQPADAAVLRSTACWSNAMLGTKHCLIRLPAIATSVGFYSYMKATEPTCCLSLRPKSHRSTYVAKASAPSR